MAKAKAKAKAKKSSPTRACVNPDCGEMIHPRFKTCPHCDAEQPVKAPANAEAIPPKAQAFTDEFVKAYWSLVEKHGLKAIVDYTHLVSK